VSSTSYPLFDNELLCVRSLFQVSGNLLDQIQTELSCVFGPVLGYTRGPSPKDLRNSHQAHRCGYWIVGALFMRKEIPYHTRCIVTAGSALLRSARQIVLCYRNQRFSRAVFTTYPRCRVYHLCTPVRRAASEVVIIKHSRTELNGVSP